MNRDALPPPEPDARRPSLESLEEKLRALPLAAVPAGLPSKLIAAIPPTTVVSSPESGIRRLWPWIGAVGVICITASAVVFSWLVHLNSKPGAASNEDRSPTTNEKETPTSSKAVQDFEQAVQFDPYNADAWFRLAKAQAEVHRTADAISSAQKAIDVGRSRNSTALVDTVEAWLRSYRASESRRSSP